MQMKLGKKPARNDSRTLKLANYLVHLPQAPSSRSWVSNVTDFGQMLNDLHGDCVFAGIGHSVQLWTLNTTGMITIPDAVILEYYKRWAGYVSGDPSTDNGAVELDTLNKWRKEGFGGHQLLAYTSVNPHNHEHVKQAICLFGGLYIGLALPECIERQVIWDAEDDAHGGEAGSLGGHCVYLAGYNEAGPICITWGRITQMTWAFFSKYCDEAYALLCHDWLPHFGDKIAMTALLRDLNAVR